MSKNTSAMASQGYPHPENNPPTYPQQPQSTHPDNFGYPQPPPAYDSGVSHPSGAYQQMQPIVTQPIVQRKLTPKNIFTKIYFYSCNLLRHFSIVKKKF